MAAANPPPPLICVQKFRQFSSWRLQSPHFQMHTHLKADRLDFNFSIFTFQRERGEKGMKTRITGLKGQCNIKYKITLQTGPPTHIFGLSLDRSLVKRATNGIIWFKPLGPIRGEESYGNFPTKYIQQQM